MRANRLLLALIPLAFLVVEAATGYAGKPLRDALLDLREQGLEIVFTTEVVKEEMIVEVDPSATEPRAILDEILEPHGLVASDGPRGRLVIVVRPPDDAGTPTEPELAPPMFVEEVVVTPSRVSLLRDEPGGAVSLTRDEILALPHLGDDFFRAVSLLPGVAANDVSAQFNVRGGRRDETQILLDGQELYEAHHLKDFDSALSFVTSSTLESADLTTGGYSVEYGDRMSGILDMTTVTPTGRPRGRIGVSVLNALAGGSGGFDDNRGSWLVELRRGTTDLVTQLLNNESPEYADAYSKLIYQIGGRHSLQFNMLYTNDRFFFEEAIDDESKTNDTQYRNTYFWLTHTMLVGNRMFVETALSHSRLDQDRRGVQLEEDAQFVVRDERESEILGLRQAWNFDVSDWNFLKWGFEVRAFDTVYDYFNTFNFDNPVSGIRPGPGMGMTVFEGEFDETHTSLYVSDQMDLSRSVTLELGLREDRYTLTDENVLSPRFNLAWLPDELSIFRVSWGSFNQSQRTYELQVEDGESVFNPTELSEQRIIGYERIFPRATESGGISFRVELYQREIDNPRPRFENLYEALNVYPELEPDRVRIAPDESRMRGIELFVQGRATPRLGWWVNYVYAETEDEFSDGETAPRSIDQPHTLNVDLNYNLGRRWNLNFAWRYHTGWPTTPTTLEQTVDSGGNIVYVPVLGPLNSEQLPDYHRLDFRASRDFRVGTRGVIYFFVDVQNVYDRKNLAGFDIMIDDQVGTIEFMEEYWTGILPSAGFIYEF